MVVAGERLVSVVRLCDSLGKTRSVARTTFEWVEYTSHTAIELAHVALYSTMGLQHAFDGLSQVVEQFEHRGQPVRDIETTTHPDSAGALAVSMTVPFSLCAESGECLDSPLTPERASLSESGDLTVTLSVSDLLPELSRAEPVVDVDERTVHVENGKLNVTVDFCIGPEVSTTGTATETHDVTPGEMQASDTTDGETTVASNGNEDTLAARLLATPSDDLPPDDMTSKDEQSHDGTDEVAEADDDSDGDALDDRLARIRSDDVPPYDDTDYLRLLYESCGTFTEMSDRIEMDVAAETVRRYMIQADIHDPNSYNTAAHHATYEDSDNETADSVTDESETVMDGVESGLLPSANIQEEQFVTDGIGLPDGVTLEDIVDAVASSPTVYRVQRSLGLDYGETHDLLRQLNVIDFVLHRIDDAPDEISKDDVVQRIRQCDTGAA